MLDVESRETPAGGSSDGLVPLPKRASSTGVDAVAVTDPLRTGAEVIERAAHLVATLDHDVEGLKSDQEEERQKIERTWESQQATAEQAMEQLAVLRGSAERLAQRKARTDLLEAGLARRSITSFPYDESTPFDTLVEAIASEVRMAKGITGMIRMEGIGELLAAATRSVDRLLANADRTKKRLLVQTQDELTAERKEARASFEIGLQVLRRDLDLLNHAVPLSARAWDDAGWEDKATGPAGRCLVRIGTYVHPRLRKTPIPALRELPGGPPLRIDPGANRELVIDWLRALVLRALWASGPGGLGITIVDPRGTADGLRPVLNLLPRRNGTPVAEIVTGEAEIDAAIAGLLARNERIDVEVLGARFTSVTESNADAGEIVEPWHLLVVLDHPSGMSDTTTRTVHGLISHGERYGISTIVVSDPIPPPAFTADGRPRQRVPLPEMDLVAWSGEAMVIELGRAGEWTVELDAPPSETEAAELVQALTRTPTPDTPTRDGSLSRLLRLTAPGGSAGPLPVLDHAVELGDPATWWAGRAQDGIGIPLGRLGMGELAMLTFDSDDHGAALISAEDDEDLDAILTLLIDGASVLYGPDELQFVLVSTDGRSAFDATIEAQLPHARLVAVDAEVEFSVAVLEALSSELARRTKGHGATAATTPRLLAVVKGFRQLVDGQDRQHLRAAELLDTLLTQGHRAGIHLVLADRPLPGSVAATLPSLRHCRSRIVVDPANGGATGDEGDAPIVLEPAALTTGAGTVRFRHAVLDPGDHDRLLWEVRARAHTESVPTPPQVYDGSAPARLDRSRVERLASWADRRPERLKPRFWLGDPCTMGGPVELLLRRTDGANLLVVTPDEFSGRGMVLAAITSAVVNHGASLELMVADFLPPETGFAESAQVLEAAGAITIARRRTLDKMLHTVKRTVTDRHNAGCFNEPPVVMVLAGIGRARDLDIDPDDPDAVERHEVLEAILREGPEVGVHTVAWCEAPATLGRRLGRGAIREFSFRAVGVLDPDIARGITGSEVSAGLGPHQALLYDEDTGRATRFRPYRAPSPEWLAALTARVVGPAGRRHRDVAD